jgi:ATP-binding protein involved in chromosome partitioning
MNIQKSQIEEALKSVMVKGEEKSLIENGLVTNIVVFGDEVNLDITINNPTLHAKTL